MASLRTTQSTAVTLGAKKGVIAFSVDGVLARATKKSTARAMTDVDFGKRMGNMLRLGGLVASHMRQRVASQAKPATRPTKGYGGRQRAGGRDIPYAVSESYATAAGTEATADSSRQWHQQAGVRFGSFDVTGGMWQGMQIRETAGGDGTIIDFRGSSLGGSGKPKTYTGKKKNKETGEIQEVTKTRSEKTRLNVPNAQKAGRVFALTGVNVIQPTAQEELAMAAAVALQHQITLQESLGEPPAGVEVIAGDPVMYGKLARGWVRR